MQTIAHSSTMRCAAAARPLPRAARPAVVVRASAQESRRSVLSGLIAGVASLSVASSAMAVATAVDIIDDQKVMTTGYNLIYEARDLSLNQATRDGMSQPRASLEDTRARVAVSEGRLDKELEPFIQKQYWVLARQQLRLQIGTLRFDLNTLAETKPKEQKKKAQELKRQFIAKVEALDFALRSKDRTDALSKLEIAKDGLDAVLASVA